MNGFRQRYYHQTIFKQKNNFLSTKLLKFPLISVTIKPVRVKNNNAIPYSLNLLINETVRSLSKVYKKDICFKRLHSPWC